jgi:hypothetical protein
VLRSVVSEYCCGGFLRTDIGPRLQLGDRVLYLGDLDLAAIRSKRTHEAF